MTTFFFWGIITMCIVSIIGLIINLWKEADDEIKKGN
jgi:hypothetical protein